MELLAGIWCLYRGRSSSGGPARSDAHHHDLRTGVGTEAILAAVEAATGVIAKLIGKPDPFIFALAQQSLKDCQRVAVVDDNLACGIEGAKRAGLEATLVLTGTATRSELPITSLSPIRSSLASPHSAANSMAARREGDPEKVTTTGSAMSKHARAGTGDDRKSADAATEETARYLRPATLPGVELLHATFHTYR